MVKNGRQELTDAWRNVGTTLLIATRAAIAGETGHTILTGALARGVVASFARRADRMAFTSCKKRIKYELVK